MHFCIKYIFYITRCLIRCCYLATGWGMYPHPRYKILLIRKSVQTLGADLPSVKRRTGLFLRVGPLRHAADNLTSSRFEDKNVRNYTSDPLSVYGVLLEQIEGKICIYVSYFIHVL